MLGFRVWDVKNKMMTDIIIAYLKDMGDALNSEFFVDDSCINLDHIPSQDRYRLTTTVAGLRCSEFLMHLTRENLDIAYLENKNKIQRTINKKFAQMYIESK